jgi:hypothetical protein
VPCVLLLLPVLGAMSSGVMGWMFVARGSRFTSTSSSSCRFCRAQPSSSRVRPLWFDAGRRKGVGSDIFVATPTFIHGRTECRVEVKWSEWTRVVEENDRMGFTRMAEQNGRMEFEEQGTYS